MSVYSWSTWRLTIVVSLVGRELKKSYDLSLSHRWLTCACTGKHPIKGNLKKMNEKRRNCIKFSSVCFPLLLVEWDTEEKKCREKAPWASKAWTKREKLFTDFTQKTREKKATARQPGWIEVKWQKHDELERERRAQKEQTTGNEASGNWRENVLDIKENCERTQSSDIRFEKWIHVPHGRHD